MGIIHSAPSTVQSGNRPVGPTPRLAMFVVLVFVIGITHIEVLTDLLRQWILRADHHHGLLAIVISFWLWRRSSLTGSYPVTHRGVGVFFLIVCLAIDLTGSIRDLSFFQHLAIPGMIGSAFTISYGWAETRRHGFALMFLFFMVPLGDHLFIPLQWLTTRFIETGFVLFGLPISTDGFLIRTSAPVPFHIVEGCAGLRLLIISLMIASLYAHFHLHRIRHRLAFLGLAAGIALVVNWIRAFLMVLSATLSDLRVAIGSDHLLVGWGLYLATFAIILTAGRAIARPTAIAPVKPSSLMPGT